ncbi:MAG: TolC family protein [Planctomycetaceae bacterium]|nr:TolC family protein [Planctomycetaceae bacterium]
MLGCAASQPGPPLSDVEFSTVQIRNEPASPSPIRASGATVATSDRPDAEPPDAAIERVAFSEPIGDELRPAPALADDDPAVSTDVVVESVVLPLSLDSVIGSVYQRYPLLQYALYSRNIAVGEQVAARGEFDLKLKGASENGPTGFYQTYRQSVGVVQPLYGGGEVFAGYRIGRGDFQPWYQERQTNDGGEFKAGVGVPLLQNTEIDPRRAALWQAQYGRNLAEPEIQAQLISFVQEASYAYWTWISAGANYHIAERVLRLAEDRTGRIQSQVEAGLIDPPELTDNLRLVAERQAKLADARRKLDQSAAKLSLYLRDAGGRPLVPDVSQLTDFPDPDPDTVHSRDAEISLALESRPELKSLDWQRRQIEVEYAQAENLTLPDLDAVVSGSQDVGQPTSKKRDKSEFELEASLYLDVPLQRRKARGKMTALEGKLAQLSAKRRMTADKIAVDVQYAQFALDAALQQVYHMREAVRLAEELAERERQNFQLGLSDLLKVTLREQYAAESALKAVDSLLQYYEAEADLRAAMGLDRLPDQP